MKLNKVSSEVRPLYAHALYVPGTVVNAEFNADDDIISRALVIMRSRMERSGISFTNPEYTKEYLTLRLMSERVEHFHVLFLDNQHALIEDARMFTGSIGSASVYPREVVKKALELDSVAVILAHNHPSGKSSPSDEDKNITQKIKLCLDLFDIRVLDHIIIGDDSFSFAERGLI